MICKKYGLETSQFDFSNLPNDLSSKEKGKDIRVELDDRNEKIGYKIREAQLQKVPYMLVVGEKEVAGNVVRSSFKKIGWYWSNENRRIYK